MEKILFALPNNELLAKKLIASYDFQKGEMEIRHFPDGESFVRILSDVKGKEVTLVCTLDRPDEKLLPLYFLSKTAKELGAISVRLISPYLAYMRQDKRFHPGEAITSTYFASLVSSFVDELSTIDPHLHRRSSLDEIYSIPSKVGHASEHISQWILNNIEKPILIGPDSESEQWVAEVAKNANAPYIVLTKERFGDKEVKVSVPNVEKYKEYTPVLVDDIISTARTMIETVGHLKNVGMKPPICIGVHAVFADNAFKELESVGVERIITCNTIQHTTNAIDISDLLM